MNKLQLSNKTWKKAIHLINKTARVKIKEKNKPDYWNSISNNPKTQRSQC